MIARRQELVVVVSIALAMLIITTIPMAKCPMLSRYHAVVLRYRGKENKKLSMHTNTFVFREKEERQPAKPNKQGQKTENRKDACL